MSNTISLASSGSLFVADTGNGQTGMVTFQTSSGGAAFSIFPQVAVAGSGVTPQSVAYYDLLADPRTKVAAGTAITGNGVYSVITPGLGLYFSNSSASASASVTWQALQGATW